MKVTFVLPGYLSVPSGGLKVEYEYANRMCARGHVVTVVHPWVPRLAKSRRGWLKSRYWVYRTRLVDRPLVPWFPLDSRVRVRMVPDLNPRFVPDADIVLAAGWQSAERVCEYPAGKGLQFYMVYDYEFWKTAKSDIVARIEQTFRAGLRMVATSPAVGEMLDAVDASPAAYIPCGIDFGVYGLDSPIACRAHGAVGLPYRSAPLKGTADAVAALQIVRCAAGRDPKVIAFGSEPWPDRPEWIEYLQAPSDARLRQFYNSLSIFLFPSHYEGWGLPGCEALACGAALVAADSVGLREYALHERTALVVERHRPDSLAAAVERLLADDALRATLAETGQRHVQQYTWDRAVDALERLFQETLAEERPAGRVL